MGSNSKKEESFRAKFEVENAGGRSSVSSDLLSILRKLSVFLEMLFDVDESNICRHIQKIEPILASTIKIYKNRMLTRSDLEMILIDATEIPIQRPLKNQRKYYSGKKKCHTMKFEIQTDIRGKVIGISKCYNGETHDFKIRKMSDHMLRDALVLAD